MAPLTPKGAAFSPSTASGYGRKVPVSRSLPVGGQHMLAFLLSCGGWSSSGNARSESGAGKIPAGPYRV